MEAVMDILGVSREAAQIRLRQPGFDKDWPKSSADREAMMNKSPIEVANRGFR